MSLAQDVFAIGLEAARASLPVGVMDDNQLVDTALNDPDPVRRRQAVMRYGSKRFADGCMAQAKLHYANGVKS